MTTLRLALVAGELSGDTLGAGLLQELSSRGIAVEAFGVGGPAMQAAGLETWFDAREISVMGIGEVVRHLPRLLRLKKRLFRQILARRPHAFIGIDLPDFNLALAAGLHQEGIATVQYVSPSVWAWRPRRVKKIARAIDLVLCLLPFETDFYRQHNVRAAFVGHPLADNIAPETDCAPARRQLDLDSTSPVVAVLPGSRVSEVQALSGLFLEAARQVAKKLPDVQFITALASDPVSDCWNTAVNAHPDAPPVTVCGAPAATVIAAANVTLLASGTVALEALLVGRPMVVSYRLSGFTWWFVRTFNLLNVERFSLPNLLAGRDLVPELMQEDARPERLAEAVISQYHRRHDQELHSAYAAIRAQLSMNADAAAATALLDLVQHTQRKTDDR
ncbi:MAG: lipid-A-disaccharide synthase [Gammaproteobacteria bacterium]|nr:lipid-A-disaccharide synthase [Gammaproteobacteria bacterium]